MRRKFACIGGVIAAIGAAVLCSPALAWNAHGHRVITRLALDRLPADVPSFLRDEGVMSRIVEQSAEPDRWRGMRRPSILHEDNQDHYIDVDDLEQFGLTLKALPRYRYEYLKTMVLAKERTPERIAPYDAAKDTDKSKEFPGFLPYGIMNAWSKLASAMQTLRVLEAVNDPKRADQLELARMNVVFHMGILSHYVGDTAQPLHTTRHFNGWVGENPNEYTTSTAFHAYIDGGIVDHHQFTYASLKPVMDAREVPAVAAADPWEAVIEHIERSHALVEQTYALQKSGELQAEPGKAFIAERMTDGARMLAAMYAAAWEASQLTDRDVASFVKFSEFKPESAGMRVPH